MSVVVKGMKMPKPGHCNECDVWSFCWTEKPPYNMFKSTCPLVELPDKHGRLVEFIDVVTTLDEDSGTEEVCLGDIMRAYYEMRNAPTIVEAEDSGCQNT